MGGMVIKIPDTVYYYSIYCSSLVDLHILIPYRQRKYAIFLIDIFQEILHDIFIGGDYFVNKSYTPTKHTGLPIKDKTLEATVQNLFCLFPYIHDSPQLVLSFN